MVAGYKKGITPNPDVACNQEIKFGLFYRRAMTLGADFVATGHYVKRVGDKLYAAKDEDKDQSYFLWTLKKEQIKHCLFPLGDLIKKTQVRQLAKKYKLPNAEKKDSQGICFIGQVSLPEFLSEFIPNRKGAIVNVAGEKLGEHQGAYYYTIGQRKGLGIGGSPVPLYVSRKDVKKNTITVAPEEDKSLYQSKVTLTEMSFTGTKPAGVVWARIRYRQPLFKATMVAVRNVGVVRDVGNGQAKRSNKRSDRTNRTYRLIFSKPQKFVAPGQSAVLYRVARSTGSGSKSKDFEMLGGGVIR
jgi:tRNA-specific 2-thiouridylase